VDFFDVERFGAKFAYTMDGGFEGEIEYENFHNQPVPFVERQFREIGGAHREFVVQRDIAAAVAFDNAGAGPC